MWIGVGFVAVVGRILANTTLAENPRSTSRVQIVHWIIFDVLSKNGVVYWKRGGLCTSVYHPDQPSITTTIYPLFWGQECFEEVAEY